MIKIISQKTMGKSELEWLHSTFHFSFAEYYNPKNMQFGALRVINDDIIDAHSGFDTHPHRDMEIITYVVDGVLTHQDSMGNRRELSRGQVQYMSAGTGIRHSEHNKTDKPTRILQTWIIPDKNGCTPQYGDYAFPLADRQDKWLKIVSGQKNGSAPIVIHQDVEISVIFISPGQSQTYEIKPNRQVYLVQIEGTSQVCGQAMMEKDGAEIVGEKLITLSATTNSHYILFDLATF